MAETAQASSRVNLTISSPQSKLKARVSGFQPSSPDLSLSTTPRDIRRPWGSTDASIALSTASSASPSFPTRSSGLLSRTPPSGMSALSALSPAAPSRTPPIGAGSLFPALGSQSGSRSSPAPGASSEIPFRRPADGLFTMPVTPRRVPSGQQLGPTFIPSKIPLHDGAPSKRRT
jgi:hypothetical protein